VTGSKVIFLDRDGVINWDPIGDYIKSPEDFRFISGVGEALRKLSDNDYKIVVISNQAGVGDGIFTQEALDRVTEKFQAEVGKVGASLEAIFYCTHGKKAGCSCRKPELGLFEQAEKECGPIDRPRTFYVGDKAVDMQAGRRFGLKTIFVLTGHGQNELSKIKAKSKEEFYADRIFSDLSEAVDFIIGQVA